MHGLLIRVPVLLVLKRKLSLFKQNFRIREDFLSVKWS